MRYLQRRQTVISALPAVLAAVLGDSPFIKAAASGKSFVEQVNRGLLCQVGETTFLFRLLFTRG
jgi:hypothetical protein